MRALWFVEALIIAAVLFVVSYIGTPDVSFALQ